MISNSLVNRLATATCAVTSVERDILSVADVLAQLPADPGGAVSTTAAPHAPATVEVMRIGLTDRVWELFLDGVPLRDRRPGFPDHLWVGWDTRFKQGQPERSLRTRPMPRQLDVVMETMKDIAFPHQLFHVDGWLADGTHTEGCFYSSRWPVPAGMKREGEGLADIVFPGEPKRGTWTPPTTQVFHRADLLEVGDVISWRFPFTLGRSFKNGERVVVSGDFDIPTTRPANEATWELFPRAQPLRKGVTGAQWGRMVEAITGQFPEAVFPHSGGDDYLKTVKERMKQLGKPKKAASTGATTGIFHGYAGNKVEFSVGSRVRLLWELARPGTTPIWVVDSPETLACYIFTVEQSARDWASGAIDYTVARARAHAFVVHQGDWEARIDQTLAGLGVPK